MEDFPGDFPGGFFWALFPTKMRRKNPARKSAKKSGGPKKKSAKNPFCRKPALIAGKKCLFRKIFWALGHFARPARGASTGEGLLPKQTSVDLLSGLSDIFLVAALGRLPNPVDIEFFW